MTYLLRNVPDDLWAKVKARAVKDGFAYPRYVVLELLRYYIAHGLPVVMLQPPTKPVTDDTPPSGRIISNR